jgi:hypothetical protein
MFCTISPSTDHSYIILKYKGDINRQDALVQIVESHALGKTLNIKRYLVDVTEATHKDSVSEDYRFTYHNMHKSDGIDNSAIIAVVTSADDHSHDFIETVSKNSGLNVRLFKDYDKAVEYLLDDHR